MSEAETLRDELEALHDEIDEVVDQMPRRSLDREYVKGRRRGIYEAIQILEDVD